MNHEPVLPAYSFMDRGVRRIAFQCPFCQRLSRHGDTGAVLEARGNDNCNETCRLRGGIKLLIVGQIDSLDALPTMPADRAASILDALTKVGD